MSANPFRLQPLPRPPGAEVLDFDARRIGPDVVEAVMAALAEHGLLILRDQKLTPAELVAISRCFGELEPPTRDQFCLPDHPEVFVVSNVVENGRAIGLANDDLAWHTDQTYFARPTAYTFLYGIETPREGADTLFCETYSLYEGLDQATRDRYAGIKIEFSHRKLHGGNVSPEQAARYPDVVHPLVRTHPISKRKSLYFGRRKHAALLDVPAEEGAAFLDWLNETASRPERVYAHKWRPGDLLIWDNRGMRHSATPYDKVKERRIVYRTSVVGEVPF